MCYVGHVFFPGGKNCFSATKVHPFYKTSRNATRRSNALQPPEISPAPRPVTCQRSPWPLQHPEHFFFSFFWSQKKWFPIFRLRTYFGGSFSQFAALISMHCLNGKPRDCGSYVHQLRTFHPSTPRGDPCVISLTQFISGFMSKKNLGTLTSLQRNVGLHLQRGGD